jgi:hypothetical protein
MTHLKTWLAAALASAVIGLGIFIIATRAENVSGTWSVVADTAEGVFKDGSKWSVIPVSGTLTLEQQGNALTGSWKGRQPEPWPLSGRIDGKTFEFQTAVRSIAAVREGQEITVPKRWIFRGTVDGNNLTGSMSLAGEDAEPTTQPFIGVRQPQ